MDAILTRMGAYDNMFSNASTFKVELDEWHVLIPLVWDQRAYHVGLVAKYCVMRHLDL